MIAHLAVFFMKISDAWANGRFQLHNSPTPELDARLLLQHLLGVNHAYLVGHGEEDLTAVQQKAYQSMLSRAAAGEPVPYITGKAAFFDFELDVSPAVLIPRPETEQLVVRVLDWLKTRPTARLVDVGTGSGCIPISVARRCAACDITAVDISPAALAVATANAARLAPNRIHFLQSDLLINVNAPVDMIVANLPYVTDGEWTRLDDGVKLHEPELALKGGADGLDLIRRLLKEAQTKLATDGAIFLEIGWQQGTAVFQLAQTHFPNATVALHQDYSGHDRIVTIL